MRKRKMFVTLLLILLCAAGVYYGYTFLEEERILEQERQQKVARLSEQLEPLNEERKQWEEKEKEWQAKLSEQQKGRSCVLLNFDNMNENLYETVYELMEQYGFRGTFAFRNGRLPGESEDDISRDEFDELMFSGWEYALSLGEEHEIPEEVGYWERQTEAQTETETETETAAPEEGQEDIGYLEQLDSYLGRLEANGVKLPANLFCTAEQLEEVTESELARRGLTIVCVRDAKDEEGEDAYPAIGERGDQIWRVDCGTFTQKNDGAESAIAAAVSAGKSAAIFINDVYRISQDGSYDVSITKFTSLLNYLKRLEEEGEIYLLTWSELAQHQKEQEQEYKELVREYNRFREEREAAEEDLNRRETEIVESLYETETASTGEGMASGPQGAADDVASGSQGAADDGASGSQDAADDGASGPQGSEDDGTAGSQGAADDGAADGTAADSGPEMRGDLPETETLAATEQEP